MLPLPQYRFSERLERRERYKYMFDKGDFGYLSYVSYMMDLGLSEELALREADCYFNDNYDSDDYDS